MIMIFWAWPQVDVIGWILIFSVRRTLGARWCASTVVGIILLASSAVAKGQSCHTHSQCQQSLASTLCILKKVFWWRCGVYPGLYTEVSRYVSWIEKSLQELEDRDAIVWQDYMRVFQNYGQTKQRLKDDIKHTIQISCETGATNAFSPYSCLPNKDCWIKPRIKSCLNFIHFVQI